jgi:hypothetical protein
MEKVEIRIQIQVIRGILNMKQIGLKPRACSLLPLCFCPTIIAGNNQSTTSASLSLP